MTVVLELSEIITLLEAQIPANPRNLTNRSLAKNLERELVKYFKALEDAFPFDQIDQLYYKHVKETLGSDTGDILDSILAAFDDTLTAQINGQLAETYISGQAEMVSWGKTKAGIPIAYEGPPIQGAIDWAEKHGAMLVTQMDKETKRRLAQTVSQGIANKRGIPGLTRDIRNQFADMSRYRSQMIARTETADALSQASLDTMKDMGIEGKEWVVAGDPCEICAENEAAGVIPVNQVFPSGHARPPGHPNCECALAPARLPAKVEPEKPAGPTGADWKKTLTSEEQEALKDWTGGSYTDMRKYQAKGIGDAETRRVVEKMQAALDKDGSYNGTAWRGASARPADYKQLLNAKEVSMKAFTSASTKSDVAMDFLNMVKTGRLRVLYKIETKTAVDISRASRFLKEAEVILRQKSTYKIVSRNVGDIGGVKTLVLHLVEL